MSKTSPPPNIDMPGVIKVIDDSGMLPKWKTIAKLKVASRANAIRVAQKHNLKAFWLFDHFGNKELIVT